MRAWLLVLAFLLIDYTILRSIEWLHEAAKVSSEMDLPPAAELAFVVGGFILLVGTPICGWRYLSRVDEPRESIPEARVIR